MMHSIELHVAKITDHTLDLQFRNVTPVEAVLILAEADRVRPNGKCANQWPAPDGELHLNFGADTPTDPETLTQIGHKLLRQAGLAHRIEQQRIREQEAL